MNSWAGHIDVGAGAGGASSCFDCCCVAFAGAFGGTVSTIATTVCLVRFIVMLLCVLQCDSNHFSKNGNLY
jgi:hypothetical protein